MKNICKLFLKAIFEQNTQYIIIITLDILKLNIKKIIKQRGKNTCIVPKDRGYVISTNFRNRAKRRPDDPIDKSSGAAEG